LASGYWLRGGLIETQAGKESGYGINRMPVFTNDDKHWGAVSLPAPSQKMEGQLLKQDERDAAFVRAFIDNGGNATEAAKQVGVSDGSASTVGHRLKVRLFNDIEQAQREALKGYAITAIDQVKYLSENARSESIRLHACKDILDRAGFKPTERQEVTQFNRFEHKTTEELRKELRHLLGVEYQQH